MRIEVTADDIREGVRLGCYDCPVALAISRATGYEAHVAGDVRLSGDTVDRVRSLPDDVVDRINDYDTGGTMEPFSFDLAV